MIAQDVIPYEITKEELRLRRKVDLIIAEFGDELLSTPLEKLRCMAQQEYAADQSENLFCRMWDEFRFVPSARWLRKLGSSDRSDVSAIASVMEAVWEE